MLEYSCAVDVWSLGCIFGELLGMIRESCESFEDRKAMFPGSTCFPLSGDGLGRARAGGKSKNKRVIETAGGRLDQLSIIFDVIGTPSEEDIAEINELDGNIGDQFSDIEPKEGTLEWGAIDRWVKWARDNKKHIIAGPLLDFTIEEGIPPWVKAVEHDYSLFRDKCYDHLERVIQRYGVAVSFWNVVSGINLNRHVKLSIANMVDLIRTARLLVKQGRKDARVMIEIAEPFSEFVATTPESSNAKVFLARLSQEGVSLDALGVQCLVGGSGGRATRDLMLMSAKLDEFLHVDFPLIISALGAPSKTIQERNGWWKSPWDEAKQELWASQMFAIALSKPFIDSVIWTDLYDYKTMSLPTAGFISLQGKPRPVMNKVLSMRKRLRAPLGPLDLPKRNDTDKKNE